MPCSNVPARRHVQQLGGPGRVVGAEDVDELRRRPHVGAPLLALGVGVERRDEPALRGSHVAQQESGDLAGDPLGEGVARGPPPVRVAAEQQGVVVEHLLEVRHDPVGVDGVAREAAGELVVHAAAGHRAARALDHREGARVTGARVMAQQELEHHRRRELRGAAEAAAGAVVLRREVGHRGVEGGRHGRGVERLGVAHGRPLAERARDALGGGGEPAAVAGPRVVDGTQHLAERRHAVARLGRVVGAGVERSALMVEEHRHGPAAVAGQRLRRGHVDGVDVGPLLAVHLHRDVVPVQVRREGLVLERLVGHDVAPVARGVPDAQQDRARRAAPRLVERLRSPLLPVDRVVLVLQQVRRCRACETVGHASLLCPSHGVRSTAWTSSLTHEPTRGTPPIRGTGRHPCAAITTVLSHYVRACEDGVRLGPTRQVPERRTCLAALVQQPPPVQATATGELTSSGLEPLVVMLRTAPEVTWLTPRVKVSPPSTLCKVIMQAARSPEAVGPWPPDWLKPGA